MGYFDNVPTGTLIGSLVPAINVTDSTISTSTPSRVISGPTVWPVIDWAFSPVYVTGTSGIYFYFDLGSVQSFNSILITTVTNSTAFSFNFSSAANESYAAASGSPQIIAGPSYPPFSQGPGALVYKYPSPISARYVKISLSGSANIFVAEVAFSNLVELQYNERQSTFTRTPGSINEQSLIMQNGRQIKIITGKATDRIHCSYAWSDDGTLSKSIYNILNAVATTGAPLFWVPPIKERTNDEVNNRKAEFINLEAIPDIIQSSATSWSMEFSGRCQP